VAQADNQPPGNTVKLSPRVRSELLANGAIASIPLHLIGPFLNEAVVFDTDELARAPRIVATQEGRVIVSRGETAYVRGDLGGARDFRLFRQPRPLVDPETKQVLGYEATFVGTAEFVREGGLMPAADGKAVIVPATFRHQQHAARSRRRRPPVAGAAARPDGLRAARAGQARSAAAWCRSTARPAGRQNQIVALNRGQRDGMERGHVLALWRAGGAASTAPTPAHRDASLPDERHGLLFVFRVFDRVSYALILSVQDPVGAGDRFTQP
jgi:hypothetical protein